MTVSYYEILRVNPSASDEDIKRAYKFLAKKHHPDMHPQNQKLAEMRFRAISEAYENIRTRDKRAVYNQSLRLNAQNDNTRKSFFGALSEILMPPKRSSVK